MKMHAKKACEIGLGLLVLSSILYSPVTQNKAYATLSRSTESSNIYSDVTALLLKTNKVLSNGDPVWILQVVDNKNRVKESFEVVSGKKNSQQKNRNTPDNESPLPSGIYSVDKKNIEKGPFPNPELGSGYWIPLRPLFSTNRTDLGIHQDPSWGLMNEHSGTAGCIGMKSAEETASLVQLIKAKNISRLVVL